MNRSVTPFLSLYLGTTPGFSSTLMKSSSSATPTFGKPKLHSLLFCIEYHILVTVL